MYEIRPIGKVVSPLTDLHECPKQGNEGAPEAIIEIAPEYAEGLEGLEAGLEIMVLTWFHKADREVLKVRWRGDPNNPLMGVFTSRSPARPNPIGLHRVTIRAVESPTRLRVFPLEALDGTPVVDIKSVLPAKNYPPFSA